MFQVALYQPEIPANTGNIIRLCANTGSRLHLIHPLGFEFDDHRLKRAGLDYHEWAEIQHYTTWVDFLDKKPFERIFAFSTKGTVQYDQVDYQKDDCFLFGPESRGLRSRLAQIPAQRHLLLPQQAHSRSLNLSNCVAIAVYEAWRQHNFQLS